MQVLEVVPNRFSTIQNSVAESASQAADQSTVSRHVRRPTRGIVLKNDTFATLRVVAVNGDRSGRPVILIDAGSNRNDPDFNQPYLVDGDKRGTDVYSNFLLQQVQEERMEKQQILETFGEPYIFLFGERARVITFQGILLNTFDFNWQAEWWANYERFIRGTRCVENDAMAFLSFEETVVGGYILGASCVNSAQDPHHLSFTFQMFVVSYTNFSAIGSNNANPTDHEPIDLRDPIQANPFRPQIVDTTALLLQRLRGGNLLGESSLLDSLSTGLSVVSRAFSTATQVLNEATQILLNGVVVRVPIGFEGSLVFDDNGAIPIFGQPGPIKYTVFSDNDDEYVGSSSHYGSSFVGLGNRPGVADQIADRELAYDQKMVDKAQEEWAQFGLLPPSALNGAISKFLVGRQIGLIAAGASDAWKRGGAKATTSAIGSELVTTTGFGQAATASRNLVATVINPFGGRLGSTDIEGL